MGVQGSGGVCFETLYPEEAEGKRATKAREWWATPQEDGAVPGLRPPRALWANPGVALSLKGLFVPWRLKPPVLLRSRTGVRSLRKILPFNHQETKILLQGSLSALGTLCACLRRLKSWVWDFAERLASPAGGFSLARFAGEGARRAGEGAVFVSGAVGSTLQGGCRPQAREGHRTKSW